MRIVPAAPTSARPTSVAGTRRLASPAALVCAALALALTFLALRIASVL